MREKVREIQKWAFEKHPGVTIDQATTAILKLISEGLKGLEKKPTPHQIACPDGRPGCCVYHQELRLSEEDKIYNKLLADVREKLGVLL